MVGLADDAALTASGASVFGISLASLRTTISTLAAPSTSTTRDDAPDHPTTNLPVIRYNGFQARSRFFRTFYLAWQLCSPPASTVATASCWQN